MKPRYYSGNALIIGGNRFVGKALASHIVWAHRYNNVDVFNRSGTGPWGTTIIQGDRNKREDLEKINFKKYSFIVDMCLYNPEQYEKCADLIPDDTNYIFVSSGAANEKYHSVFGQYGTDKLKIEEMLHDDGKNYKIVRPTYIVGNGNHLKRLGYYLGQLRKGRCAIEVDGDGDYEINLVFVQDVVECLFQLAVDKNKTMKNYDICGDESISVNNLIQKLLRYYPTEYVPIQSSAAPFKNTEYMEFDNSAIKQDYGVTFTSLDEGIKDYVKWFKEEGLKKYGYIV
jgi:nucleoside-diphosphate-sugar epimerase